MKWRYSIIYIGLLLCGSCSRNTQLNQEELTSIQLIDRHGVRETVSTKERLKSYQRNDFLLAQPYEKVVRVFNPNREGQVISKLTSYHGNGQIKQYLEVLNGRAHGIYREWYENGQEKVHFNVIEGVGDLSQTALKTFIIDGLSRAWDSDGNIIARISYMRGVLVDSSYLYHINGQIKRSVPYQNGVVHGVVFIYDEEGNLQMESSYDCGLLHGESISKQCRNNPAFQEKYEQGLLLDAIYYDYNGDILSKVEGGRGIKSVFIEGKLNKQCEISNGKSLGSVRCFDTMGNVTNIYHLNEAGEKEGIEIVYYPNTDSLQLQLGWLSGEVHGIVKTWYTNGILESEREFSHNKKEGMHFAWYIDGSIMLVEEYENDILLKGTYYKLGKKDAVSTIQKGSGIAMIYDGHGHFVRKVDYCQGVPSDIDTIYQ
ncbi:MAG: toxin-antitoxin system YwqK family antitoxin [Chlamydiales bacterium]